MTYLISRNFIFVQNDKLLLKIHGNIIIPLLCVSLENMEIA